MFASTSNNVTRSMIMISSRMISNTVIVEPPTGQAKSSVIFLHGLGDTADGWKECAPIFQQSVPHSRWIFPNAPERPMTYAQGLKQTSWYDIVSIEDRDRNDYKGLDESRDVVLELINNELEKGIPPARIMIGGFSQGAVVSLHTAIQYKGILAGTIALSGYLAKELEKEKVVNTMTPFIMCHGTRDEVIPFSIAQESFKILEDKYGIPGTFYQYPMGHELIPNQIADITNFLFNKLS